MNLKKHQNLCFSCRPRPRFRGTGCESYGLWPPSGFAVWPGQSFREPWQRPGYGQDGSSRTACRC
jgi:hypothetical protein